MDLNDKTNVFPYPRGRKDAVDPPNIVHLLNARQLGTRYKSAHQLKQFAELKATVSEMKETHCQLPPSVRSTFLMSFSHDCSKVASTHGDHNIYVSDVKTGRHIQKLEGHPRTPWSIAFHPTSNDILASGCLAGQVRVWDLHGRSETWKAENDQVIASLTFHPFLQLLVIAVGNCLYFWDWSQPNPSAYCCTNSEIERIRFVKFDHYGHRLITGISNRNPSGSCNSCVLMSSESSPVSDQSDNDSLENFRASRSIMERLRSFPDSDAMDPFSLERTTQGRLVRYVINPLSESSSGRSSRSASSGNEEYSRDVSPEPITVHSDASGSETVEATDPSNDSNQRQNEPEPEFFTSGEIWNTFVRLRVTCSDLEKRLMRQVSFSRSDESGSRLPLMSGGEHQNSNSADENNPEGHGSPGHGSDGTAEQDITSNPYTPLLHMLAHIRMTLHFSTLSLTAVRDRIDQIRVRINEILQRLRYWTGRRPVGHLHREIFEEMISQLSGQMESLVQADERLASTVTLSERASSIEQNFHQSAAAQNVEETTASRSSEGSYVVIPGLSTPGARVQSIQIVTEWPLSNERNVTLRDGPQVTVPSIPGRSVSNASEDNSRSTSSTPSRVQEHFPRYRFNPLAMTRTFRRNLTPQFSASNSVRQINTPSRRFHQQNDENNVISSAESDDESFFNAGIRPLPRLALASRRRNAVNASVHQDDVGLPAESADIEGLFRNGLDFRYETVSESSDDTDRPSTPPLLLYSPSSSLLFNGTARMVINDPQAQNHRIQSWSFSPYKLPAIYDATANVVARRCVIHNDASVDISQDGEKLVCLIPPEDADRVNNLMFGVFSLRQEDLGRTLCVWGYVSNAISVSFSPLSQYVVIGSAYSRPMFANPEKATVAQIIKIQCKNGCYDASYVRSFTQIVNNENRFQHVSLNCVRWLPQPGLGIAYATNRGLLCICKPTAGWIFENIDESNFERSTRRNPLRFVRAFMRPI